MNRLTNNGGVSLAMAVWLAHDDYTDGREEFAGKNVISVTSLLKPTRQIVLANRVPREDRQEDVLDRIAARFGQAIHNDIEHSWEHGYAKAMAALGYPQKLIDSVVINPDPAEVTEDMIPVYLEQRSFREIDVDGVKIIISGKFDQIIAGEINDTKTTSVYAYINRSKEDDYQIQGSAYRWLNPKLVTSETMKIQHIFTDWQRSQSKSNPKYPPHRMIEFSVDLLSEKETESWIKNKLREIIANQGLEDPDLIRCGDKDLWRSEPQYKYYADPAKAALGGRSTKNFDTYSEAQQYAAKQGKGTVIVVPGKVKACPYCPGRSICNQSLEYDLE